MVALAGHQLKPLRWYQDLELVRNEFRKGHKRVLLCMPTGAGKTLYALWMAMFAIEKGHSVLFLTDRRALARQLYREAEKAGFDVGLTLAGEKGGEDFYPFRVASKDTLLARAIRTKRMELPKADLVIVDEVHRAAANQFQILLQQYPDAWHLGLTATPILPNGKGMGAYFDSIVTPVKPSQLLAEGFLVPAVCYAPDIPDLQGVRKNKSGEWNDTDLAKKMNRKNLVGNAVGWWRKYLEGRRSLGFACDRDHAKHLQRTYINNGIRAGYLDQDSTDQEFDDTLAALAASDLDIVWNVGKCVEGIDVPAIDGIQLMRPFRKIVWPWQIFGRAMRPSPATDKENMIVVDHAGVVLLHGLPGTDIDWPFNPDEGCVEDLRDKELKEKNPPQPVRCKKCGFVFMMSKTCPQCGAALGMKAADKAMGTISGQLVRVSDADVSEKDKQRKKLSDAWMASLAIAANKDYTFATAARIFQGKTGMTPDEARVTPRVPDNQYERVAVKYPNFVRRKK